MMAKIYQGVKQMPIDNIESCTGLKIGSDITLKCTDINEI